MFLIFCRFGFLFWILLQEVEGVVTVNNDPRIQVLLTNSSFLVDKLVFRHKDSIEPHEMPTSKDCKQQMTKWFNNLNLLKTGECKENDECRDSLNQLDAFARFPSPGEPNIYDGSFQKCNELNEKGGDRRKYCYVIQADEEHENCRDDYHSVLFEPNRTAFGICGPEVCHGKDFSLMFGSMEKPFNFMMDRPICAVFCTVREIPKKTMFYVFTSFLIMLTIIVFFSSLYDYIRDTRYRLSAEDEKVFGQRAILSWSVWSNIEFLFKEHQPGYIKCLDCLRSITFTWIVGQNVVGHLAFYDKDLRATPNSEMTIAGSALSSLMPIYTYLFMSGLTVSYTFIRANPSMEILKRPITWLVFYFHRWIRLTSALMVFIGFFDAYGKYIQGPYDALTGYSMVTQTDQCLYWSDIIHISNFKAVDKMCYLPAWHLAVDFQFTLVAPVFLMAFYYSSVIGTSLAIIASLVGSAFTVFFFIKNDFLHSAFTGNHRDDDLLVEIILSKPWNQLAPYMLGMIVGYFLAKNHASQKIIHPIASIIIWTIVSILGISAMIFGNRGSNPLGKALTNVLTRAVWSICLIWIIVSSQMKWAGPIGHFLEHSFWRPFGKLSYCAFIVHHMALYFLFNMEEQAPRYVSFWHEYFHYTIPIVICSYFMAFFLSLLVEIPMIRLDKIILDKCIPASKIEEKEELGNDDDDGSDIEIDGRENSDDFSDKSRKHDKGDERSIEEQNEENDQQKMENSLEEPLLSSEYI